jgi:hypothetical protein
VLETTLSAIVGGYHPELYCPETVFISCVNYCVIGNLLNLQQLPIAAKVAIVIGFLARCE